jgi:hypothetical protein
LIKKRFANGHPILTSTLDNLVTAVDAQSSCLDSPKDNEAIITMGHNDTNHNDSNLTSAQRLMTTTVTPITPMVVFTQVWMPSLAAFDGSNEEAKVVLVATAKCLVELPVVQVSSLAKLNWVTQCLL